MLVLLLDSYHLGDPLFLTQLARTLAARKRGMVLVHNSAEDGERALEAMGVEPVSSDGAWTVTTEAEVTAVERSGRELNRRIVSDLNEAGVPTIRVMGSDRGLLKLDAGSLVVGRSAWLGESVAQGVVSVVTSYTAGEGPSLREFDPAHAASILARSLGADPPVMLGRVPSDAVGRTFAAGGDLGGVHVHDGAALRRVLSSGGAVAIASLNALQAAEPLECATIRTLGSG